MDSKFADSTKSSNTFPENMTFLLKEKVLSLSGDSFDIKDQQGVLRYKIKGNFLSIRDSKTLNDANGNPLYRMRFSLVTLHNRQYITDAKTGAKVAVLRQKSFVPFMGTRKVQIWLGSKDEGEPWLLCAGSLLKNNFKVTEVATGKLVSSVHRKLLNVRKFVWGKDTYVAEVLSGINAALMIMCVVAIDEIYH